MKITKMNNPKKITEHSGGDYAKRTNLTNEFTIITITVIHKKDETPMFN